MEEYNANNFNEMMRILEAKKLEQELAKYRYSYEMGRRNNARGSEPARRAIRARNNEMDANQMILGRQPRYSDVPYLYNNLNMEAYQDKLGGPYVNWLTNQYLRGTYLPNKYMDTGKQWFFGPSEPYRK